MEKIYFKELNDIKEEIIKVDWGDLISRFTPNRPYIIIDVNYITKKTHDISVKTFLIKNDFGIGEWVYEDCFFNINGFRNKQLKSVLR